MARHHHPRKIAQEAMDKFMAECEVHKGDGRTPMERFIFRYMGHDNWYTYRILNAKSLEESKREMLKWLTRSGWIEHLPPPINDYAES